MRLFVGVPIPDGIRTKLVDLQKDLEKGGADLKLVESANFHFTAKFLGDVSEGKLGLIKRILSEIAQKHTAFRVHVKGIGVFPRIYEARQRGAWQPKSRLTNLLPCVSEGAYRNFFPNIFAGCRSANRRCLLW